MWKDYSLVSLSLFLTRVEEHAGGLPRFEVERNLVDTADDGLASRLRQVVEEVLVAP